MPGRHEKRLRRETVNAEGCCTNRRTDRENPGNLVQHFLCKISYLRRPRLLPKLSVEGSIPFARSNVFKGLFRLSAA